MRVIVYFEDEENKVTVSRKLQELSAEYDVSLEMIEKDKLEGLFFDMESDANSVDLVIMDADMMKNDGIEVAKRLREEGYTNELIFFSKNEGKVFDSFVAEPLYYILNEDDEEEHFKNAFCNAVRRMKKKRCDMLSLSYCGETRNIDLDDIYYFESHGRLIEVNYKSNGKFQFYSPISRLENLLLGKGFVRIYKSIIVNTSKVVSFTKSEVLLRDEMRLPMSLAYYKKNQELLKMSIQL